MKAALTSGTACCTTPCSYRLCCRSGPPLGWSGLSRHCSASRHLPGAVAAPHFDTALKDDDAVVEAAGIAVVEAAGAAAGIAVVEAGNNPHFGKGHNAGAAAGIAVDEASCVAVPHFGIGHNAGAAAGGGVDEAASGVHFGVGAKIGAVDDDAVDPCDSKDDKIFSMTSMSVSTTCSSKL